MPSRTAARTATAAAESVRPAAEPPRLPAGVRGPQGEGALPWLEGATRELIGLMQTSHAVLVQGLPGLGQLEVAVAAAQALLCEDAPAHGVRTEPACGRCPACRLVQARTHPDLLVLLPEAQREATGWSSAGLDEASPSTEASASSRRKPSRELRVDDLRQAVLFAQTTAARGGHKVVVVHPAERMNAISANALLKTLEEPSAAMRLVLGTGDAARLLPTLRSRCLSMTLQPPVRAQAQSWLVGQGLDPHEAEVLLTAAGGQPFEALAWRADGIDAQAWLELPRRAAAGDSTALQSWPVPRLIEALTALCCDQQRRALGAAPVRWPAQALPPPPGLERLNAWGRRLLEAVRHADHPWHAPLAVDALVAQAAKALQPRTADRAAPERADG